MRYHPKRRNLRRAATRWLSCASPWLVLLVLTSLSCRNRETRPNATLLHSACSQSPKPLTRTSTAAFLSDSGLGQPEMDLGADRLHERVNGAAPWLQSIGCRRLLAWTRAPSLEIEVLVFDTVAGAKQALDKDSAGSRTHATPGEEGWTNAQVVYFRRSTLYCRLTAPDRGHAQALIAQAQRVDQAILSGDLIR